MAKVSNYKFQIRGTLVVWGSTVSISNDLETNTEVSFTNEACLLYNDDKTIIERIRWSATGGTLTLSKRGMVNTSETESSWLEKERREGAFGALTTFAPQVVDAIWANTFTAINTFEEAPVLEKGVASVIFANATARNAALWWNWSATQAYTGVQTWWVQQYYNLTTGQWEDVDTGTVTPNASTTAAGTVGIPTNTQVASATDTWETGAKNAVLPSQLSPAILTEKATFVWADKLRIADSEDSDSAKYIDASLIKTVVPNATETASWLMPERATDAETLSWEADKFPDASQIKDNYTPKSIVISSAVTFDDVAISNIVIAHWLWRTPHSVNVFAFVKSSGSGSIVSWSAWINWSTITQNTAYGLWWVLHYDGDGIDRWTWSVSAVDSSNVTLSYAKQWGFAQITWTFYAIITW